MSVLGELENNRIILGKINGFYGVKGYVKIFSETRPRDAILAYKT
jgi:16S rRNA processing protein RimM